MFVVSERLYSLTKPLRILISSSLNVSSIFIWWTSFPCLLLQWQSFYFKWEIPVKDRMSFEWILVALLTCPLGRTPSIFHRWFVVVHVNTLTFQFFLFIWNLSNFLRLTTAEGEEKLLLTDKTEFYVFATHNDNCKHHQRKEIISKRLWKYSKVNTAVCYKIFDLHWDL